VTRDIMYDVATLLFLGYQTS